MATIPYMQLYVADYLADTAHLTTVEHGAYLLLIMAYWQRGKTLPASDDRLARMARLSPEEWAGVRDTIAEFFTVTDDEWKHDRIERDLEAVRSKSEKASNAGKASAERRSGDRSTKNQRTSNERSTDVERTLNERSTDADHPSNERSTDVEPCQISDIRSQITEPDRSIDDPARAEKPTESMTLVDGDRDQAPLSRLEDLWSSLTRKLPPFSGNDRHAMTKALELVEGDLHYLVGFTRDTHRAASDRNNPPSSFRYILRALENAIAKHAVETRDEPPPLTPHPNHPNLFITTNGGRTYDEIVNTVPDHLRHLYPDLA